MDIKILSEALGIKDAGLSFPNKKNPFFINDSLSKLGIDAIYYINSLKTKIPVIYFKELETYDSDVVINLHRNIWNEGKSPFLVLILPNEIRVYNTFIPTPNDTNKFDVNTLIKKLTLINDINKNIERIKSNLSEFSRDKINSGEIWKSEGLKFDLMKKIDVFLLSNLKLVRNKLAKKKLSFDVINQLIIRSIFISYMQDRKILTSGYFKKFGEYENFMQVLDSKKTTYDLFKKIYDDFNGDVFNVTPKEKKEITQDHLKLIKYFLSGAQFYEDNEQIQTSLFPYCFNIIPIELISSLYEEFLRGEDKKKSNGSHYTPHHLVELSLDGFYKDKKLVNKKILDSSCGSGIFLVESYKRLVEEWYYNNKKMPTWQNLKNLLLNHIYGVDLNDNAVRVAIFSLYLKMLDFLDPKDVWRRGVKFPHIYNNNIISLDFFNPNLNLNKIKFDYFIGNPPWESLKANDPPVKYCDENNDPISDNQIAQAFIWKISRLSNKDSQACLILPAKSILFNKSETNKQFKRKFFENHNVKMIMNLSSMRHNLFQSAVGPSMIAIYSFNDKTKNILYINPKSSFENLNSSYIIVNSMDMTNLPIDKFLENQFIWKTLMWGDPIDVEIIEKISKNDDLKKIISKNKLVSAEGFVIGKNGKTKEPRLKGMSLANTKSICKFSYLEKFAGRVENELFYRAPTKNFQIFIAPHIIIRKNVLMSAYSNKDIAFTHAMLGIHGEDKTLLKYISVLINSNLMKYYFFLTASAWGVERDNIHSKEIKEMPVRIPNKEIMDKIVILHDKIQEKIHKKEPVRDLVRRINQYVYRAYDITPIEVRIIEDTLIFDLSLFEKGISSISYERVNKEMVLGFVKHLLLHINRILKLNNMYLNAEIYFSNNSLEIISLSVDNKPNKIKIIEKIDLIEKKLLEMKETLKKEYSKSLSLKKDMRLYLNERIILIRYNEKRFWSFKQAIIESNRLLSEILTGERSE